MSNIAVRPWEEYKSAEIDGCLRIVLADGWSSIPLGYANLATIKDLCGGEGIDVRR